MTTDHIYALPPGLRLEEYRLDEVLGSGGFGITYRAYDAHLDKFVAIKEYLPGEFAVRTEASTVSPKSGADAEDYHWGLSRFLDEARTLARFDHPHLNKVHRFFERNGTAYIVLEYVDGETLASRLSRVTYLEETALRRLLEEVLSGLSVVHEAGYVHRDVKPGNLMLRAEDGGAVVLDFGAARQAVGQRSRPITSILTPGYAPIEQYDSKADDVGPWSDLYALGMVSYRCISGMRDGELPDAVTRSRLQRKGVVDLMPAVEAGEGRYSGGLLEAIDWALEVDEGNRPQSVAAWQRRLAAPEAGEVRSAEAVDEPGPVRRAEPVREDQGETDEAAAVVGGGRRWGIRALLLVGLVVYVMSVFEWLEVYGPAEDTAGAEVAVAPETETETVEAELQGPADTPEGQPAGEAEVARLLAAAEADLAARRLTRPLGNNAWEKYQQVLSLAPAHPEALAGIERVVESYRGLFDEALAQGEFDRAAGYLERVRELNPDSPLLSEGERRLAAGRLAEVERQRQAEVERQRQAEAERQRQAEAERQRQAEAERQRQAEAERQRQAEAERQRQAEVERRRREAEVIELNGERVYICESLTTILDASSDLDFYSVPGAICEQSRRHFRCLWEKPQHGTGNAFLEWLDKLVYPDMKKLEDAIQQCIKQEAIPHEWGSFRTERLTNGMLKSYYVQSSDGGRPYTISVCFNIDRDGYEDVGVYLAVGKASRGKSSCSIWR